VRAACSRLANRIVAKSWISWIRKSAAKRGKARQSAIRRMPLEELGLMFCVWLAWAGQLAHMALLSEREDE
jgi:hypothetical protein